MNMNLPQQMAARAHAHATQAAAGQTQNPMKRDDPEHLFVRASACDECLSRGRHVPATHARTGKRKTLHVCEAHRAYFERLDWSAQNPVVKGLRPPPPVPPPFEPLSRAA
jgi:hypothetical protein